MIYQVLMMNRLLRSTTYFCRVNTKIPDFDREKQGLLNPKRTIPPQAVRSPKKSMWFRCKQRSVILFYPDTLRNRDYSFRS